VLDALRARLPRNKKMTPAVTIKELVDDCMISRRQVQICLRRLDEKGIINRFAEEAVLGNPKGYRYRILKM
jgi:predicted transcriptional regulator